MKFTLRRILAAALSLTLLGGTLAGCGNDDTTMESEAAETAVQGVTFTDALGKLGYSGFPLWLLCGNMDTGWGHTGWCYRRCH